MKRQEESWRRRKLPTKAVWRQWAVQVGKPFTPTQMNILEAVLGARLANPFHHGKRDKGLFSDPSWLACYDPRFMSEVEMPPRSMVGSESRQEKASVFVPIRRLPTTVSGWHRLSNRL